MDRMLVLGDRQEGRNVTKCSACKSLRQNFRSVFTSTYEPGMTESAKLGLSPRRSARSIGALARHRRRPGEASRAGHLYGNSSPRPGSRTPSHSSRSSSGPAGRGGFAWHSVRWRQALWETGGRFGLTWDRRRVAMPQVDQENATSARIKVQNNTNYIDEMSHDILPLRCPETLTQISVSL